MKNDNKLSLAEKNRLRTTKKIKEALDTLKKRNMPINISSVSKMAKVSRKTLSTNRPDLKAMVEEARSLQSDSEASTGRKTNKGTIQSERVKRLREKNRDLIEDKKKILEQNMILTKENTKLRDRIADLEDKLYSRAEYKVIDMKKK